MARYSDGLVRSLWDAEKSDALFARAATIMDEVAHGNFDRDNIRTQQFTEALIRRCGGTVRRALGSTEVAPGPEARNGV